jgi:hypothetical protein
VSKRSPILGYNHNVRYRGLVFHVQTEDSGLLAPHLFTHLFHAGVIISTRKYVYDAGSTEETIKSLMQAQHKAVMKELRRGLFDDKIDQYLGETPGLLPRGVAEEAGATSDGAPAAAGTAETAPVAVPSAAAPAPAAAPAAAGTAETAPVAAPASAAAAPAAAATPAAAPATPAAAASAPTPPAAPAAAKAPPAVPAIPKTPPPGALPASRATPPPPPKAAPPAPTASAPPTAAATRPSQPARQIQPAEEMAQVSLAALAAASVSEEDVDDPLATTTITDPVAFSREPTLEDPAIALRPTELAVDPRLVAGTATDDEPTIPAQLPPRTRRAPTEGEAPPLAPPPQVRPYTADELYATMRDSPADSQPEITIQLEVDDSDRIPVPQRAPDTRPIRRREPHDTEMTNNPWDPTRVDPAQPISDGIPGALAAATSVTPTVRNSGDASGPISTAGLSQRAAKAVGAASLPPARPIARPASRPATPSAARPATADDRRTPVPVPISGQSQQSSAVAVPVPISGQSQQSSAVPAPSTESTDAYATLPVGEPAGAPERPGQYSQHSKISTRIPPEPPRDGARALSPQSMVPQPARPSSPSQGSAPQIPVPRGSTPPPPPQPSQRMNPTPPTPIPVPGRVQPPPPPGAPGQRATPVPIPVPRQASGPIPVPRQASGPIAVPQIAPVPQPSQPSTGPRSADAPVSRPSAPAPVPGLRPGAPIAPMPASRSTPITIPMVRQSSPDVPRPRTPTPQRVSVGQAAAPGLAPGRSGTSGSNSGVVMSRPAVIVGGPAKPGGPNQRVRKAREDEGGRGFGQGLISEKSLDEVILAYLSEDAEDK